MLNRFDDALTRIVAERVRPLVTVGSSPERAQPAHRYTDLGVCATSRLSKEEGHVTQSTTSTEP